MRTNEYTTKEGVPRSDLELRATAVGADLARCISKIERQSKPTSAENVEDAVDTVAA
ncbi:hypothetical protein GCM10020255_092020 [Rhodococcus baikonurensis]